MIFQEPMTSLNPVPAIGQQIREVVLLHSDLTSRQANALAAALLARVTFLRPKMRCCATLISFLRQRQRVMTPLRLPVSQNC